MKNLHKIQLEILRKLLFSESLTFTELKPSKDIENNQFNFHLTQLISMGHIIKSNGGYELTLSGKEYANRMDTESIKIKRQGKISALMVCIREKNNDHEVLIFTRKKQPFFDHQGFISGKVDFGEKVVDAAKRELKEETNLEGECDIFMIRHYIVLDKDTKNVLEDKFMYYCVFREPTGSMKTSEEGIYEWVKFNNLLEYLEKPFGDPKELIQEVKVAKQFKPKNESIAIPFEEIYHVTDSF